MRTTLPVRPSIPRSTGSRRSSTSFWNRSGKSSTSASRGARAPPPRATGGCGGALSCDAAYSPARNPASYPAPYPGDWCSGGSTLGGAICPPPPSPPSETAAALPPALPATAPPLALSPPRRLLARVSMAAAPSSERAGERMSRAYVVCYNIRVATDLVSKPNFPLSATQITWRKKVRLPPLLLVRVPVLYS
jgi:hypothetical protein